MMDYRAIVRNFVATGNTVNDYESATLRLVPSRYPSLVRARLTARPR
jgi:hypothetical protein